MGYKVGRKEARTIIQAKQDGMTFSLTHIHSEPKTEQLKEYQRLNALAAISDGGGIYKYGDAEEKLWEEIIIKVEGYQDEEGNDLMQLDNWKALIPLTHKIAVINQTGNVWIPRIDRMDKAKNSEGASS